MRQPLAGLTVIDLGQRRAGPYACRLLADFGATVIKVEPPHGDAQRRAGPFPADTPHRERAGEFLSLNSRRRNATLNLKSAAGRRLLLALVARADALVENLRPGALERLGLGVARLWEANPQLVVTSITNFGATGPDATQPASELGVFMAGGSRQDMGTAPRRPIGYAEGTVSYMAGAAGAAATLAALRLGEGRGTGVHAEVALQEVLLGVPNRFWLLEQFQGQPLARGEARRPFTYYHCADGYACVSPGLGLPGLLAMLADGGTAPPAPESPAELDALVAAWCIGRTRREVVETGQRHHVMTAPVLTAADLVEDPTYRRRAFFHPWTEPTSGASTVLPGSPARFVDDGVVTPAPAPRPGADNATVLDELGVDAARLPALRRAGVI